MSEKKPYKINIPAMIDGETERLDKVIASNSNIMSRNAAQKAIEAGLVQVNSKTVFDKKMPVSCVDDISIEMTAIESHKKNIVVSPEDKNPYVIYEDNSIIIVNKPAGLLVHPTAKQSDDTLVNRLIFHFPEIKNVGESFRPGIVHRIDQYTSGLLVVARTVEAYEALIDLFQTHNITREYFALIHGNIKEESGTIDTLIDRDESFRLKRKVSEDRGVHAITHFEVVERFGNYTFVKLTLETGKTHQIRVHMSYIKHPIVGDPLYGAKGDLATTENKSIFVSKDGTKVKNIHGQLLHAGVLGFMHPSQHEYVEFRVPIPEDFNQIINKLRTSKASNH